MAAVPSWGLDVNCSGSWSEVEAALAAYILGFNDAVAYLQDLLLFWWSFLLAFKVPKILFAVDVYFKNNAFPRSSICSLRPRTGRAHVLSEYSNIIQQAANLLQVTVSQIRSRAISSPVKAAVVLGLFLYLWCLISFCLAFNTSNLCYSKTLSCIKMQLPQPARSGVQCFYPTRRWWLVWSSYFLSWFLCPK